MADKTKLWKGIPLTISTNVTTAETVVSILGIDAAKSPPSTGEKYSDWTSNIGGEYLKNQYNAANNTNLSQNEFNKIFQKELVPILNNVRASDINSNASEDNRRLFAQSLGVPKVIDPVSGNTVSSSGDPIQNPVATTPDSDPQNGTSSATLTPLENVENTGGVTSSKPILKYPYQTSEKYDYIQIIPFEYEPSITNIQGTLTNFSGLKSANKRIENSLGVKIFLPMTPGISESNSVAWGDDRLNAIQARFGGIAMDTISKAGENPLNALKDFGSSLLDAGNEFINQQGLSQFISAYFAGQAVGANLLGRAGVVINPNLELLFQGPKLRSFRYNFKFTPRDDEEAKIIRAIIKTFKKTMAVKRKEGNIFLGAPYVYKLKYVFNGDDDINQDHPFLNKIKPCALTSFNVNYSPDGSYMTYQDGSMTSYAVDMQFDELEPIYNDDLEENVDSATMGY